MDKGRLYENRIGLEEYLKQPNEFSDSDNGGGVLKGVLKYLVSCCENEDEYQDYKEKYLEEVFNKERNKKWITVNYMFAGIGQYKKTFPEEELKIFKEYIDGNGSAFLGSSRPATKEEIKSAIALAAGDDNVEHLIDEAKRQLNIKSVYFCRDELYGGDWNQTVLSEVCFNRNGKDVYVAVDNFAEFTTVIVSENSCIEKLSAGHKSEDPDKGLEYIDDAKNSAYEVYDFEYGSEEEEDYVDSDYYFEIITAINANEFYCNNPELTEDDWKSEYFTE